MLKKLIGFRTKYSLLLQMQKLKGLEYFKNTIIDQTKNQAYIFLAADYGNLGDVAITYAQTKFLKEHSDFQVIEIPISQSLEGLWWVKRNIKKGDLVTTVGGGNMGEMYDQIEFIRQLTFQWFPKNRIISFPQTFDFTDAEEGKKALEQAKKIYNNHQDLHLVAREKTSYGLMQKHFLNAKVHLTPDIVLSLDETQPKIKREGAVLCLRADKEKNISTEQQAFLVETIHQHFTKVTEYDTHINEQKMSIEKRTQELNKIWNTFRSAELVITDRLHGMIFCYITGTPCLVFQNNNHKVRETYEWIKGNQNIQLITEFDKYEILNRIKNNETHPFSLLDKKVYEPILKKLKQ